MLAVKKIQVHSITKEIAEKLSNPSLVFKRIQFVTFITTWHFTNKFRNFYSNVL